ncbi:MAG TPA: OmpA family protein [Caulobacteraceae bacterium]|jgi:outer membrane protein OmpA-like peptidoglycan-associated protein
MRRAALVALCAALSGCASPMVALLPGEGGASAGGVVALDPKTGAEQGELTQPNTQAVLDGGAVRPHPLTTNYDALLAVMPPPPKVFTLYFVEGTASITPDSQATLDTLRAAVTPQSDVQIIGYTDTVGDNASNDKLSLDRATEIRAALVADGLPVGNAKVTGRGERDLLVPTGQNVAEPRNRRVEVILR